MSDEQIVEFAQKLMKDNRITKVGKLRSTDSGLYDSLGRRRLLDQLNFETKQRSWKGLRDEEVVEIAKRVMEEKEITGRDELEKADSGLYGVLRRRGLLEKVGFEEKYRSWKGMSNDDIIEIVRKEMERKGITGRGELEKAELGLYQAVQRRGLLEKVGFERKRRSWDSKSNVEVVELVRKEMERKGITGRGELQKSDPTMYIVLRKRGLLGEVGFAKKQRKGRAWSKMSDDEVVELAAWLMEKEGVDNRSDLSKKDSGLYQILNKRGLLGKIEFEGKQKEHRKRRLWRKMSDEEVIRLAKKLIREEGIGIKAELQKSDPGLYDILRKRGLLDGIEFEQKQRSWKGMSDEEVLEHVRKLMIKKEINDRRELREADNGLYMVLRRRGLLDRAFAHVDQQRNDKARDAVIDALTKFANSEKPEVEVA